jgi:hypothetical protein
VLLELSAVANLGMTSRTCYVVWEKFTDGQGRKVIQTSSKQLLRNIGELLPDYVTPHPSTQRSQRSPP